MDYLNDYELIYLIRDNNEIALNLLYEKYRPLIFHFIKKFHIYNIYKEDFIQEGYMSIHVALQTYSFDYDCSFLSYLKIIMQRHFQKKFASALKYDIPVQDLELYLDEKPSKYNNYNIFEEGLEYLHDEIDILVYVSLYKDGLTCKEISNIYNIDIKKVYNTIQKIKKILNKNIKY